MGEDCTVEIGTYQVGGGPAIQLYCEDGSPMATATINVPSLELPENYVVVKDQDENEGMMEALVEAGIVRPTGLRVVVGYYSAPVAELLVAG
ncbi:hypothetical protein Theco_4104 (plasmid) [Thermobacillus composti KWC4]|uniref:Uncharacterized protein n=1 Tax=Thermobacillus composti (strain DSM 18247 / JCM 13945 / KWC4) TaxID=717605 RepID=L0EJY0_THECK|nr:hypothetical protein Theco_4104 [Thermobacillus composti KWC4]